MLQTIDSALKNQSKYSSRFSDSSGEVSDDSIHFSPTKLDFDLKNIVLSPEEESFNLLIKLIKLKLFGSYNYLVIHFSLTQWWTNNIIDFGLRQLNLLLPSNVSILLKDINF